MAVTAFQSDILKLLARHRRDLGESYVAGGVALNILLNAPRRSRDIDLFHDTEHALRESWRMDRECLVSTGYRLDVLRETLSFVEARVIRDGGQTELQWVRDSAFRFFPLIEDDLMGLVLHPFDLATNKVLAMAGRLEVRDWVDLLRADDALQPLGLLVWAACGKDPGYNPASLLAAIRRHHYSQEEINMLDFDGEPPQAADLGARWHAALNETASIFNLLPAEQAGTCVLTDSGTLFNGSLQNLAAELAKNKVVFHKGHIRGAWPIIQ
ncbi:MAG: hypothetical protein PHU80_11975 [Kiritimatiellae bacterium]|nr:hypothetical protein [Kiritimatiellia bacterium]